jgi:hypothetical protein
MTLLNSRTRRRRALAGWDYRRIGAMAPMLAANHPVVTATPDPLAGQHGPPGQGGPSQRPPGR